MNKWIKWLPVWIGSFTVGLCLPSTLIGALGLVAFTIVLGGMLMIWSEMIP